MTTCTITIHGSLILKFLQRVIKHIINGRLMNYARRYKLVRQCAEIQLRVRGVYI